MNYSRHYKRIGVIAFAFTMCSLLINPANSLARDPDDPGKGFDYVFYGYSPAFGNGGPGNRAMLLLDIDDARSPRPYPDGPKFKFLAENIRTSGRLDILTVKLEPKTYNLIGIQDNNPARFIFTFKGLADNDQAIVLIQGDAALEAGGLHYLRAVIDVVHPSTLPNGKRTRYIVNCEAFNCDAP